MKHRTLAVCVALLGLAALSARAEDPDAQKKELEAKKTQLQAKAKELRDRILQSDELKGLYRKAEQARQSHDEKLAKDKDLKKARESLAKANETLARLVAEKSASSPEAAAIMQQRKDLQEKRRDLAYREGLITLKLNNPNSPILREAEADSEVRKLRRAADEAAWEAQANPSDAVRQAQQEASKADAEEAKIRRKIGEERKVAEAAAKVAERQADLQATERGDPRQAKLTEARAAQRQRKEEVLAKIDEAKPLLKEAEAVAQQIAALEQTRKAMDEILEAHREALKPGDDGDTRAAREKVEKAQKAYDKALKSSELDAVRKAADEAVQKYAQTHDAQMMKIADYVKLSEQTRTIEAKQAELKAQAIKATSSRDLKALIASLVQADQEYQANFMAKREIRMKDETLDKCYSERGQAQGALRRAVAANPDASAADRALAAAEGELKAVLDKKLEDVKAAKELLKEYQAVGEQLAELRYRQALARYQLSDKNSPLDVAAEADKGVAEKRAAVQAMERDIRDNPSSKAAAADKKLTEAQDEYKALFDEAKKDTKLDQAEAAAKAADAALKKARAADPKAAAAAQAKLAADEKRAQKVAKIGEAKPLIEQLQAIRAEQEKLAPELKKLDDQARVLPAKLRTGGDAAVVAARKAIEDAQKQVSEIPQREEYAKLLKEAADADNAAKAREKELLAADKDYQATQKELGEIEKQLKELARKARQAAGPTKAEPAKEAPKKGRKAAKAE